MFSRDELSRATEIVRAFLPPTPQIAWPLLAERTGCEVWVKHENHLPTGAFKVRGGLVLLESMTHGKERPRGIISATRGNHGQSLAFAGSKFGIPVTIVVPHGNSAEKNASIRSLGATLIEAGKDFDFARREASRIALEQNLEPVLPFHPKLVCGVATYAMELFQAVSNLDAIYAPIGMGSGLSGLIRAKELLGLPTDIIGVVSTHAPAFALSFDAGHVVTTDSANTFADGMACREPMDEAFQVIRKGAARIVRVSDTEVTSAIRGYWSDTHNLAEGAGAAPLAALLQEKERMRGKRVGLVLSGGNIDLTMFLKIMKEPGIELQPAPQRPELA